MKPEVVQVHEPAGYAIGVHLHRKGAVWAWQIQYVQIDQVPIARLFLAVSYEVDLV